MKNLFFLFSALFCFAISSSAQAATLPDVVGHPYETAIRYLEAKGIVQGYPDGFYRPEQEVNRAEFTKIIFGILEEIRPTIDLDRNCFPDVRFEDWFSVSVCYVLHWGIINGYPDGLFRPANTINLSEAAKILVNALDVEKPSIPPSAPWYQVYIQALQVYHYIPSSFQTLDQPVTRAQLAELVYRVKENITNNPFKEFVFTDTSSQNPDVDETLNVCLADYDPEKVNIESVRSAWLDWHNQARAEHGVDSLTSSLSLNYSASVWADSNKQAGQITHERPPGQGLSDWFQSTGVSFGNSVGENLGMGNYFCNQADCTQVLTDAVKGIFDLFMAEEGATYTGHYDNVVGPQFAEIGFGLGIDEATQTFYLTSHYAGNAEFGSDVEVCE